jgi:hypothetical protein
MTAPHAYKAPATDRFLSSGVTFAAHALLLLVSFVVGSLPGHVLATSRQADSSQRPGRVIEAPVAIPFELLANRPVIRAKVNGMGPFAWLVAPEGEATLIDQALVRELNLKPPSDGTAAAETEVEIDLGTSTLTHVRVRVVDVRRFAPELTSDVRPRGVITAAIWKDRLVTIDYSRFQVIVAPGSLPDPNGQDVFTLKPDVPEFGVTLAIGGRTIACRLDPQFPGSLLLSDADATELPLAGRPVDIASLDTAKGRIRVRQAQLAIDVTLGVFQFARPLVSFAGSGDVCTIGSQRLIGFSVTYDIANARVRLARQPAR